MGTKQTPFQPDHTGKRATVPVHPAMTVSHNSHAIGADTPARHGERPNIARDAGRGKHLNPVPVAAGMHRVTGTNEGAPVVKTLDSIPDASNPNAMDPTKPGKVLRPAMPHPSMRSRVNDPPHGGAPGEAHAKGRPDGEMLHALGRAILAEATSSPDDRQALTHLGVGTVPPVENR